jgi:hypothetical protein
MEGLMEWRVRNRKGVSVIAEKMKMKARKKGRRMMKLLLFRRSLRRKRLRKCKRQLLKSLCKKSLLKNQLLLPLPVRNVSQLFLRLLPLLVKNRSLLLLPQIYNGSGRLYLDSQRRSLLILMLMKVRLLVRGKNELGDQGGVILVRNLVMEV